MGDDRRRARVALAQGERVRRDLLEDLLAGRPPEAGARLTAARDAGLRPDSECVLVVAWAVAGHGQHDLRSATTALARAAGTPVHPLAVVRQDEIVVIVPAEHTDAAAFAAELATVRQRLAGQGTDLAIGMSAVQADLSAAPLAHREAWEAMELTRPRGGVLALATLRAFDYLTLFGRPTAEPPSGSFRLPCGGSCRTTSRRAASSPRRCSSTSPRTST